MKITLFLEQRASHNLEICNIQKTAITDNFRNSMIFRFKKNNNVYQLNN